jgi:hypothetical protein
VPANSTQQAAPSPSHAAFGPPTNPVGHSAAIPAGSVDQRTIESITPLELQPIARTPLWGKIQWGEDTIRLTQKLNANGASVYLLKDFNWQRLTVPSLSLKYCFDVVDLSWTTYLINTSNNPLMFFSQGMGHAIQRHLLGHGLRPSESQFSLEGISTVLAANDLSEIPDDVPAEHQATAALYIFLKYCLSRFSFVQIAVHCNGAGTPLRNKTGQTQWGLEVYVDLGQTIGICREKIDGTYHNGIQTQYVRMIFDSIYSEQRMQFVTAHPISQSQFKGARRGELIRLHTPGKKY